MFYVIKINECINCGVVIDPRAKRCKPCNYKYGTNKTSTKFRNKMREIILERKNKFGYINSLESRKKMSITRTGRSAWNKGKTGYFKQSLEARKKIGDANRGEKCNFWKGGISHIYKSKRQLAMTTIKYRIWRDKVFERDNYTCQECGERGEKLNAHHIKSWKEYQKLRYLISNGITLCRECHKNIHKKGLYIAP